MCIHTFFPSELKKAGGDKEGVENTTGQIRRRQTSSVSLIFLLISGKNVRLLILPCVSSLFSLRYHRDQQAQRP